MTKLRNFCNEKCAMVHSLWTIDFQGTTSHYIVINEKIDFPALRNSFMAPQQCAKVFRKHKIRYSSKEQKSSFKTNELNFIFSDVIIKID